MTGLYLTLITPGTQHVWGDVRAGVSSHCSYAGPALTVTDHLQPLQLLQDVGGEPTLSRGSPARHGGELTSKVLLGRGQTDGGVDGQVCVLGQSHQGDVVAGN